MNSIHLERPNPTSLNLILIIVLLIDGEYLPMRHQYLIYHYLWGLGRKIEYIFVRVNTLASRFSRNSLKFFFYFSVGLSRCPEEFFFFSGTLNVPIFECIEIIFFFSVYKENISLYILLHHPLLMYACPVWIGVSQQKLKKIQTFHNKILQISINV